MEFEEALKELETIAQKLENGNCSLDESIELYEKAMKLSRECSEKIETAKLKITDLEKAEKTDNA